MFSNIGKHGTWAGDWFKSCNFLGSSSAACAGSKSQRALGVSQSVGTWGFFSLGVRQWKAHILGKRLTPAPLLAHVLLSLSIALLSIWTCSISTSPFPQAALSAAQRGTNSLLIGTYLGNDRNPIVLSNCCSLPLPNSPGLKISSFCLLLIFLPSHAG